MPLLLRYEGETQEWKEDKRKRRKRRRRSSGITETNICNQLQYSLNC
jgi:hypothetical protein